MPPIKLKEIISYSSQDVNHPAKNLLKPESYLKWKCDAACKERQSYVILKLDKLSTIHSIDIGNEHSGLVEILAGREGVEFKVLLVSSSFMTPFESRNSSNTNRVRMFGPDKLSKNVADQEWDRIKIICTQSHNKNVQYGLSFIHLHSSGTEKMDASDDDLVIQSRETKFKDLTLKHPESESNRGETMLGKFTLKDPDVNSSTITAGSLFAKIKENGSCTSAAAIRAASKAAVLSLEGDIKYIKRKANDDNEFFNNANQIKRIASDTGTLKANKQMTSNKEDNKASKQKTSDHINSSSDMPWSKKVKELKSPLLTKVVKNENPAKTLNRAAENAIKSKPFAQLMDNVVFVMSGYQNPKRSQLRDKLLEMGAKYKGDWDKTCTHLICAYANTPKFNAVKGKGKIVNENWILDCYNKKKLIPWRRYNIEKNRADESEDEILASELLPNQAYSKKDTNEDEDEKKYTEQTDSEDTDDEIQNAIVAGKLEETSKNGNLKKSEDEYDADTDVDEDLSHVANKIDTSNQSFPELPNIFNDKAFFIYGSFNELKQKSVKRYIIAFGGKISNYMDKAVNYVISESSWDDNFDDALTENPSLSFVKPQWIWKCCNKQKLVPSQPFLITCTDT